MVEGRDPVREEEAILRQARGVLDDHLYSTYEQTVERFFRDVHRSDRAVLEEARATVVEINSLLPSGDTKSVAVALYATTGPNRVLVPRYKSLRLDSELLGWMRLNTGAGNPLLTFMIAHELWHMTIDLTYSGWKEVVDKLIPLWLLKQAAILNYPPQEMVCDMAAESTCKALGKLSRTRLLSYLERENHLAYADFQELKKRIIDAFIRSHSEFFENADDRRIRARLEKNPGVPPNTPMLIVNNNFPTNFGEPENLHLDRELADTDLPDDVLGLEWEAPPELT